MIHKVKPCSFSDTELHSHLEKLGKKKIVLGGDYLPLLYPPKCN